MLPPQHRLRRSVEFGEVVRRGRRASRPLLTVHLLLPAPAGDPAPGAVPPPAARSTSVDDPSSTDGPVRAGLVVSKAVGGSVVRSRTARRLRHLLRDRLGALPPGARLVVRAAPAAATASSAALGHDLDGALASAGRPRTARSPRPARTG